MDIVDLLYSTMRLNINSNFRNIRINTVHIVMILNAGIWVRESELVTEKQRARERQRLKKKLLGIKFAQYNFYKA